MIFDDETLTRLLGNIDANQFGSAVRRRVVNPLAQRF
jgi:hypothetical protein